MRIKNILYFLVLLLTGCHTQNIHLTTKAFSGSYNTYKNALVFFKEIHLWLPSSGIAVIPDGGIPKTLYKNTSLYHFQKQEKVLTKIYDFGNLPYNYSRWKTKTSYGTNLIAFSITPIEGWREFIEINPGLKKYKTMYKGIFIYTPNNYTHNRGEITKITTTGESPILSPDDSIVIYTKREKVNYSIEMYNLNTQKTNLLVNDIDIEPSTSFFKDNKTAYWLLENGKWLKIDTSKREITTITLENPATSNVEISTKELEKLTKDIPYSKWGFNLQEYWPRSTKGFITDIVEMRGNLEYRIAVLQMLKNRLSQQEINKIITRLTSARKPLSSETLIMVRLLYQMIKTNVKSIT